MQLVTRLFSPPGEEINAKSNLVEILHAVLALIIALTGLFGENKMSIVKSATPLLAGRAVPFE